MPRDAQRRRTRKAIVEAAQRLLAAGGSPSVAEIAAEADVSRRTIYTHFPTHEQLLLDATAGSLSATGLDPARAPELHGDDVPARVEALVRAVDALTDETLPLGRRMIRLTVEGPADRAEPRRGYRRVEWIEHAIEPLRDRLTAEQHERLVSALSLLIGWEAAIVLRDVRGLTPAQEAKVTSWAARAVVDAMLAEAGTASDSASPSRDRP